MRGRRKSNVSEKRPAFLSRREPGGRPQPDPQGPARLFPRETSPYRRERFLISGQAGAALACPCSCRVRLAASVSVSVGVLRVRVGRAVTCRLSPMCSWWFCYL